MKERHFLLRIARKLAERVMHRAPDFIVGGHDDPYLQRWYVLGAKPHPTEPRMTPRTLFGLCRIYVHRFDRSAADRAHHDHPAASLSLALWGKAVEHTIAAGGVHHRRELRAGQWRFRRATFAHRIEIAPGEHFWTLFIFFRNSREWGFHCPRGWVHWKKFVASSDPGAIGAGCGEESDSDERCESGLPECGPVEHWDSEGVPLCSKCWSELENEVDAHG